MNDKTAKVGSGTHCFHGVLDGFPCVACHPEPPAMAPDEASVPVAAPGPRSRPSSLAERMRRRETPSSS